jgi:chromate transporter
LAADPEPEAATTARVGLTVIAREWGRIGITGFGGPPAHIALLRRLCIDRNGWLSATEFEDGVAATSLLPGPASTQLAIFCAWRLAGPLGAIVGGVCFIVPGLIIILALSALFLAASPPGWVTGAAAGAGAAVPAVAVSAAIGLVPASWRRANTARSAAAGQEPRRSGRLTAAGIRWLAYLAAGGVAANLAGQYLVVVLLGCGLCEWLATGRARPSRNRPSRNSAGGDSPGRDSTGGGGTGGGGTGGGGTGGGGTGDGEAGGHRAGRRGLILGLAAKGITAGVAGSIVWVAVKVGALSFGGGFVIIPLMQHDAVHTYHWMTTAQFLSAVALGQVTPGPVVQTIAVVGYAAAGLAGGLLAAFVAFAPSFAFVLLGGPHFDRFRRSPTAQAFLAGSGPAAIGAIAGAAVTLGFGLTQLWQVAVLAGAIGWLVLLRRGVVSAILAAAAIGVIVALTGLS